MNKNKPTNIDLKSTSTSNEKRIAAFFYGSFIRQEVMNASGFHPKNIEVATLRGYDIDFDPHANIFRSDEHSICGILVYPSHEELNTMYGRDGVGVFLPEAIIIETKDNRCLPATCYMPPTRGTKPADLEYIERIIAAAQEYQFPAWYINRLDKRLSHS